MTKRISLLAILALSACAGSTPQLQYFELKQNYQVAVHFAAKYKKDCTPQPADAPCHSKVADLRRLDALASEAFARADEAIFTAKPDDTYAAIALNNAKVAFDNFKTSVLEDK